MREHHAQKWPCMVPKALTARPGCFSETFSRAPALHPHWPSFRPFPVPYLFVVPTYHVHWLRKADVILKAVRTPVLSPHSGDANHNTKHTPLRNPLFRSLRLGGTCVMYWSPSSKVLVHKLLHHLPGSLDPHRCASLGFFVFVCFLYTEKEGEEIEIVCKCNADF